MNIYKRYDLTNEKIRKILIQFINDIQQYNIQPTFPVTASVLQRSPTLFQKLEQSGVEFAIHGFKHIDYTQLSLNDVPRHWRQALTIFNRYGVRARGFRFPFLRRDSERLNSLKMHDIMWDSSDVISWPLPEHIHVPEKRYSEYQGILKTYQVKDAGTNLSLPYFLDNLIEMPVSMPDDDILVERLGLDTSQIEQVWQFIFDQAYTRAEMFILQLHPERYIECRKPLLKLIKKIRQMPDVWTPTLTQLASWWQKRSNAVNQVKIERPDDNTYRVVLSGPDKLWLTVRNPGSANTTQSIFEDWTPVPHTYNIVCPVKPVIGIRSDLLPKYIDFCNQEGYLFEEKQSDTAYALEINHFPSKDLTSEFQILLDSLEHSLLRIWRWPKGIRSVFVITGDIDGLDFWDYWIRFYGN